MEYTEIKIRRDNLAETVTETKASPPLEPGQIRLSIEQIGLSANNISYASTGDALGYWAHFSREADWGVLPVWGFAVVTQSNSPDVCEGERIFGFLPMASATIMTPTAVADTHFADTTGPRAQMHPWYTRCYRCGSDPAYLPDSDESQPILWALFMTGWMMAEQLEGAVDSVYISSASSKTALSLAWALKHCGPGIKSVGITSTGNREFTTNLDVYSEVVTYEDFKGDESTQRSAYIDIAGNAKVTSNVHVTLEGKLTDSILIGGTHRAPSATPLPMPGPAPRFFFIPDVAEEKAKELGFANYHANFAKDWLRFAGWANDWLQIKSDTGAAAIEAGYQTCLSGGVPADTAMAFSWK